jgi:hypothetical protein
MPGLRTFAAASLIALITACNLDVTNPPAADSQLRVVNISDAQIDITVDGQLILTAVSPANVSALFVTPGSHQLTISAEGTSQTSTITVGLSSGQVTTTYAFEPNTSSLVAVQLDTGGAVAVGKIKVRVANFSKATGIQIWRTQPDFPTPTLIQTPFPYLAVSPYLESTVGAWEVYVTNNGSTTKLATTGLFSVLSQNKATVVLMDSSGVPVFRVMPE